MANGIADAPLHVSAGEAFRQRYGFCIESHPELNQKWPRCIMQCKDVMLTLVYTCRKDSTVEECAQLMRDQKIGFVPIVDERDSIVGVVTDRDIVTRVIAEGKPVSSLMGNIMTAGPLLSCRADEDLRNLEERMGQQKKSRAVVLDGQGKLVGVISLSDIAEGERSASLTGQLLKEVTRRESVAITRP